MAIQIIPLAGAVLCEDCQMITQATQSVCLACGSKAIYSLQAMLEKGERLCEHQKFEGDICEACHPTAGAGEQRGETPDDGTEHEFDDSDGIGECSVRVILPGNGWYRCGKTKEEHRPTGDAADQIVSSLYRRFKDWSKRGFGPDDVTWCEVKADVIALMRAELSRNHPSHAGYKAQEAQPLPAPKVLRELLEDAHSTLCSHDHPNICNCDRCAARELIDNALAELSRTKGGGWIDCKQELPPEGTEVLTMLHTGIPAASALPDVAEGEKQPLSVEVKDGRLMIWAIEDGSINVEEVSDVKE